MSSATIDFDLLSIANPRLPSKRERANSVDALVAACQSGDRDAQARLFLRFRPRIHRLILRMADEQDAADLLQQVFLQAFTRIHQFSGKSQFDTWLHRIAINIVLQHHRKASRQRLVPLAVDPPDERPRISDRIEESELLRTAFQQVDADLRNIFCLREIDQLSYREIAAALDLSEGTVASRLHRARHALRDRLVLLGWQT